MRRGKPIYQSAMRAMVALLALALAMFGVVPQLAHAANPIQVTVTILRFKELEDPAGPFEKSHGTYYGYVNIANQGYQDTRSLGLSEQEHNPDITPYWRISATVDRNLGTIPIFIQIKDDDTGVPFSVDDVMDLNPQVGVRELHINFNLNDGSWVDSDNNIANTGWSKGNGDTKQFSDGGEQGELLYSIGFGNDNLAGDGIPDGVKHFGARDIDSGNLVADMAALGADLCRKTVAIQVDYMSGAADGHTHKPLPAAVALATNTYDNAPVAAVNPCPYPGFPQKATGIKLILDVKNAVAELPVIQPDDANFNAIKQANFNSGRAPYFFYLLMVHDQTASGAARTVNDAATVTGSTTITSVAAAWTNADVGAVVTGAGIPAAGLALPSGTTIVSIGPAANTAVLSNAATATAQNVGLTITPHTSSSGLSCPAKSRDYIVSLGSWSNEVGTATDQGSSIMHELGHCLGLGHGGADGVNCKPNYLSLMNYAFQTTGIPSATGGPVRFDYSAKALPTLDESALVETSGLGGDGKDLTTWTPDNGKTQISGSTSGALDWDNNGDNGNDPTAHAVDVNALSGGSCGPVGTTPNPSPNEKLTGYDDWDNLQFRAPLAATANGSGVTHPGEEDVTYEQAQQAKAYWATVFVKATGAAPFSGVEGAPVAGVTVATFTDSEPTATAANFTATVNWGDGTTSAGTITGGGPFTVSGTHTYAEEGLYTVTMTLRDPGNAFVSTQTSASISDAPLTAQGTNIVTLNPLSGTIATFTDADPAGTASDYTAAINWGDGTTSAGTVVASGTEFAVNATHSFAVLGPYTATITITDAGGATATATTTIVVFAFPSGGDFVTGNGSTRVNAPVTFWGAQWTARNLLSGGPGPVDFKGFENGNNPPACGVNWATDPGNSSGPSATVPSYMGVVVSSTITQAGALVSGNTPAIIVVKTDSGYSTNPGHPGTGTVFAVYCGSVAAAPLTAPAVIRNVS